MAVVATDTVAIVAGVAKRLIEMLLVVEITRIVVEFNALAIIVGVEVTITVGSTGAVVALVADVVKFRVESDTCPCSHVPHHHHHHHQQSPQ